MQRDVGQGVPGLPGGPGAKEARDKERKETMKQGEVIAALKELLTAWDLYRARWIARRGDDRGFSEWFTKQVKGGKA